jgi:hypothetical protein
MLNIISDRSTDNGSICLEIPLWEEETKGKSYLDIDNYPFIILEDLKYDYVDQLISYASELLFDEDVLDQLYYDMVHYIVLKLPLSSKKAKFMMEIFDK